MFFRFSWILPLLLAVSLLMSPNGPQFFRPRFFQHIQTCCALQQEGVFVLFAFEVQES